jgi:hypothetical protein
VIFLWISLDPNQQHQSTMKSSMPELVDLIAGYALLFILRSESAHILNILSGTDKPENLFNLATKTIKNALLQSHSQHGFRMPHLATSMILGVGEETQLKTTMMRM